MAPHATGHTLPLGTGTKRKREAFRTKESPNHTWSPKPASKSTPMPSQKHQRAASIHRHRMERLPALALLTRSLPKTIWFHQVTLDCRINASSSPPTLSWQFVKDSVFIKRTNAECIISVWKQQMAPVQTNSGEDDSLLGYFYQCYAHNPLWWWGHVPTRQAETRQQQWTTSREVFYIFRDGRKTHVSWFLAAVCAEKLERWPEADTWLYQAPLLIFGVETLLICSPSALVLEEMFTSHTLSKARIPELTHLSHI